MPDNQTNEEPAYTNGVVSHTWVTGGMTISNPPVIWTWKLFGNELMVVSLTTQVPLWRRVVTRIFLGSKWTRADDR